MNKPKWEFTQVIEGYDGVLRLFEGERYIAGFSNHDNPEQNVKDLTLICDCVNLFNEMVTTKTEGRDE